MKFVNISFSEVKISHFRRSFSRLNVARNSVASSRRLCRERFCGAPLLLLLFLLLLVLPLSIARVGLPTGRREEAVEKSPRNGRARRRPGLGAVHAAPQIRTDRFPVVSLSPTSRTRLPTAPSSLVRSTRAPGSVLVAKLLTIAPTSDASRA